MYTTVPSISHRSQSKGESVHHTGTDTAAHGGVNEMGSHVQFHGWCPCGFIVGTTTKIVQGQVKIMAKASRKGVSSAVAAVYDLQLLRRDVALEHLVFRVNMWPGSDPHRFMDPI